MKTKYLSDNSSVQDQASFWLLEKVHYPRLFREQNTFNIYFEILIEGSVCCVVLRSTFIFFFSGN